MPGSALYDALELVSATTRDRVSELYVEAVLTPVVTLFATAVREDRVNGDPHFLTNAFLHLARAASPDDAVRTVELFLNGARPR